MTNNNIAMSREILEFSSLIDEHFELIETAPRGFLAFLLSLFL